MVTVWSTPKLFSFLGLTKSDAQSNMILLLSKPGEQISDAPIRARCEHHFGLRNAGDAGEIFKADCCEEARA